MDLEDSDSGELHVRPCSSSWPRTLGLAALSVVGVVGFLVIWDPLLRMDAPALISKWAGPMTPDEVLPKKEWAKVFKVHDSMDDPLTQKRWKTYSHHWEFVQKKDILTQLVRWQEAHFCPPLSIGTEILGDEDMRVQKEVPSASDCQRSCTQTKGCVAWTWVQEEGKDFQKCFRRTATGKFWAPTPKQKDGVVSGLPCSPHSHKVAPWPNKEMEFFKLPKPPQDPPQRPRGGMRILCIAVCLPFTKEQDLLLMQYRYGLGIFSCDNFAIYSSISMELSPGVLTRRVSSTLLTELGGSFMTMLNLAQFMAVWKQVLFDGEYLHHDWILKVDPDTVFLVNRLRPILKSHGLRMGESGRYLNNCKDGMHGPLEVFSRQALISFAESTEVCAKALDGGKQCKKDCDKFWDVSYRGKCNGPCTRWWGEDIWCDQCLDRFTDAERVFEPKLLVEANCDPPPGWENCELDDVVAFHPFKEPKAYKACIERAMGMQLQ